MLLRFAGGGSRTEKQGKSCWQEGEWTMQFRRSLRTEDADQWEALIDMIKNAKVTGGADKVKWALEKSGQYTTRSMYRMLLQRGG